MIEINLLPEDLAPKPEKFTLEPKYFLLLVPLVFAVLLIWHLGLGLTFMAKSSQLHSLQAKLKKLNPQIAQMRAFEKELGLTPADVQFINGVLASRILWSEKLNALSMDLPDGIWFNGISASPKELVIKATVVSLQQEEVGLINKFMKNLRQDDHFSGDFSDLQFGMMQKKQIGGIDVVDFTLTGIIKDGGKRP